MMFAVINRFNRSWEEAATDLGANAWQRLRYVTLPILMPGIIGTAIAAFTLSYDEYARTTLTIGARNTLPLEIYALISSATSPTLFVPIGTLTTVGSFLLIGVTLLLMFRIQRPLSARRPLGRLFPPSPQPARRKRRRTTIGPPWTSTPPRPTACSPASAARCDHRRGLPRHAGTPSIINGLAPWRSARR